MTQLRAVKAWYSADRRGFIELQDDVLGIVSQVRQLYGDKITVELDDERGVFHFVAHGDEGETYLIFTVSELDQRALDRLQLSDTHNRYHQDPYDEVERAQDALDRAKEQAQRESISAMGEELLFHMQREGQAPFLPRPIYLPKGLTKDA